LIFTYTWMFLFCDYHFFVIVNGLRWGRMLTSYFVIFRLFRLPVISLMKVICVLLNVWFYNWRMSILQDSCRFSYFIMYNQVVNPFWFFNSLVSTNGLSNVSLLVSKSIWNIPLHTEVSMPAMGPSASCREFFSD